MTFKKFRRDVETNPNHLKSGHDLNPRKYKAFVLFKEKTEKKFFKLLTQLSEMQDRFAHAMNQKQTRYSQDIFEYQEELHHEMHFAKEKDQHKSEILIRLRTISKALQ